MKRNPNNGQLIKMTNDEFIEKASIIHKHKYDYSKSNYLRSNIKIEIICPIHGSFWQRPTIHLKGIDCLYCGYDKTHSKTRSTKKEFINKANKIHNNKYNYLNSVYKDGSHHITIICPNHGEFNQTPEAHLQGRGCPKCKTSKGENIIKNWLENNSIKYEFQKTFDTCKNPKTNYKLRFDFYIPSKNLLIEYDGQQHFQKINTGKYIITQEKLDDNKYRDEIKTNYSIHHNIKLLRISYENFNKINTILTNELF
jgi:hypothetical protein